MKIKKFSIITLALVIVLMLVSLVQPFTKCFAEGETVTKITQISILDNGLPDEINSNMNLLEYWNYTSFYHDADNPIGMGISKFGVLSVEWIDKTTNTTMQPGDPFIANHEISLTIEAKANSMNIQGGNGINYEFDESLRDNTSAVKFHNKPVDMVTVRDIDDDGKGELYIKVNYVVKEVEPIVYVDTIKVKNAKLSYKGGDKIVFTAESGQPDLYSVEEEIYSEDEKMYTENGCKIWVSSYDEVFGMEDHEYLDSGEKFPLLEKIQTGRTYYYTVALEAKQYVASFAKATAIEINGKTYNLSNEEFDCYDTWIKCNNIIKVMVAEEIKEENTSITDEITQNSIIIETPIANAKKLDIRKIEDANISTELKNAEKDLKAVFSINVLDDNDNIIPIENNKLKIKIKLTDELKKYNMYEVVYIKDGKVEERLSAEKDGDYLVFITTHLSDYGVIAKNLEDEKDKSPKTGTISLVEGPLALIIITGIGLIVLKKKTK